MRAKEFTEPRAAGCIIVAEDTGRWCLQQRSDSVSDPGLWSTWGGGVEPGESLEQTVRRELAEEGGYTGPLKLEPLLMNQRYATYIGHVPHEFEPQLNSESQDSCWVEAGEWPRPLHPGLQQALAKIKDPQNLDEKVNIEAGDNQRREIGDYSLESYVNDESLFVYVTTRGEDVYEVADAEFRVVQDDQGEPHLEAEMVRVKPEYRNQGVATAIYQYVKSLGNDILPSKTQLEPGKKMWDAWKKSGAVAENFADKKVRGKSRPGRVERAGASCAGSVTDLRARAKRYGGEKGKMYHWCANMKAGKKK